MLKPGVPPRQGRVDVRTPEDRGAGTRPIPIGPPRAIMYVYPWDLYDHGVESALDDLQACGIDAVQLSFTYHVATFLAPRNPRLRVKFGELGVLQFDPDALLAAAHRSRMATGATPADRWPFQPPVSTDVSGPSYMSDLLDALASRGLPTIAWVVYLYSHNLAQQQPALAIENAFGDRHGAQLCPANPSVRAYAHALTTAVAAHEPLRGLVVESLNCLPFDYGFLNLKAAVVPDAGVGRLLSVCFCPDCQLAATKAGIAVAPLRAQVKRLIDAALAALPDGPTAAVIHLNEWLVSDSELSAYLRLRSEQAESLQREVLEAAHSWGLQIGTTASEGQDEWISAVSNDAVRDLRDEYRFEIMPTMSVDELEHAVAAAREAALYSTGREEAGAAGARPGATPYALTQLSHFQNESYFRRGLEAVHSLGIRNFRFYEYGLLTERQLSWLRNASELWELADDHQNDPSPGKDGQT